MWKMLLATALLPLSPVMAWASANVFRYEVLYRPGYLSPWSVYEVVRNPNRAASDATRLRLMGFDAWVVSRSWSYAAAPSWGYGPYWRSYSPTWVNNSITKNVSINRTTNISNTKNVSITKNVRVIKRPIVHHLRHPGRKFGHPLRPKPVVRRPAHRKPVARHPIHVKPGAHRKPVARRPAHTKPKAHRPAHAKPKAPKGKPKAPPRRR